VLTCVMTGCSGSKATPEAPPTSSATSEPSSSATTEPSQPAISVPSIPADARQPGKAGARAQVKFLIAHLNYSMLTGDTTMLRKISAACSGCKAYADLYETTYRRGGMFDDSTWTVASQLIYKVEDNYYSFVDIKAAPGTYRERGGAELEQIGKRKYRIRVVLAYSDGGWKITDLEDAS
jgi:hypothetical protein